MSGHALRRQKTASRWYWLQVRIHDEPSVENVEICSVYYCSISSNEYLFSRHFGTRLAISDFSRMAMRLLTSALETPSSSAEPARLCLRTTTRNIRSSSSSGELIFTSERKGLFTMCVLPDHGSADYIFNDVQ